MISRKTIISLALVFVMVFSCVITSYADTTKVSGSESDIAAENAAEKLYIYGLFKGGANGFNLDGTTTKAEAAVMVVRLLGAEDDALTGVYEHPYTDVKGWSSNYIGYLYENGILEDTEDGKFVPNEKIDTEMFLAMILNSLGYVEKGQDLTLEELYEVALDAELLTETEINEFRKEGLTRSSLVLIAEDALDTMINGVEYTLFQFLDSLGVIENFDAPTDDVKYGKIREAEKKAEEEKKKAENQALTAKITSTAKQYMGIRYRGGGKSPSTGFDCSGFVGYVMIKSGVWDRFYGSCDGLMGQCKVVSRAEAKPGDIVFFKNTYKTSRTYTHVGIYLGNNQMIHSASSSGISVSNISSGYWGGHYACIARPTAMM